MASPLVMEIGFSLGSNLGDRLDNLARARDRILAAPDTTLAAQASVYETEPVGVRPEYEHLRFLNSVVIVRSEWPVEPWLARLGEIENELARTRSEDRYAPRTIDVDILYAGDSCIDSGGLTVPHPRWMERRFVLLPLAEIRPDLILPGAAGPVREILQGLPPGEDCTLHQRDW